MDAKYLEEIKARIKIGHETDSHAYRDIPALIAKVEGLTAENQHLHDCDVSNVFDLIRRDQQIATLKKALFESTKYFNCSRCSYGRGKDCGKRPHENCADVFIRKAQEAQQTHETQQEENK